MTKASPKNVEDFQCLSDVYEEVLKDPDYIPSLRLVVKARTAALQRKNGYKENLVLCADDCGQTAIVTYKSSSMDAGKTYSMLSTPDINSEGELELQSISIEEVDFSVPKTVDKREKTLDKHYQPEQGYGKSQKE